MPEILGHVVVGRGPCRALLLNDWIGDTTTWDPVLPLLDRDRMTWAMTDLRGYGRSRMIAGVHDLFEAAADVLATADALGWERFAVVGHSMSSLIALHLGRTAAARVERLVVVAPPPPGGLEADDATMQRLRDVALGNRASRMAALGAMWGDRLSSRWLELKAERWEQAADPQAVADYVDLFATTGLPDRVTEIDIPVLAITGERDAEAMRSAAVCRALVPLCAEFDVESVEDAAHYPMQEAPPLTYTFMERFLLAADGR